MVVRRYFVSGKVQGVGFRAFVWRAARHLGLTGWVRNRRDGRVEALVEANPETHALFCEQLNEGPMWSRVDDVTSHDEAAGTTLGEGFSIVRDA